MRTINISQKDVLAMHGSGMSRKQVAQHYGVTSEDMYNVYQQFGMYKTRTQSSNPEYRINPVFDFNTTVETETVVSNTTEESMAEQAFEHVGAVVYDSETAEQTPY